ncbi:MAG TPA: hypothetical protein DCE42_24340 [Myxococcales bacterium]|nr:hypothetical protein [Myxococcales bacterium]
MEGERSTEVITRQYAMGLSSIIFNDARMLFDRRGVFVWAAQVGYFVFLTLIHLYRLFIIIGVVGMLFAFTVGQIVSPNLLRAKFRSNSFCMEKSLS